VLILIKKSLNYFKKFNKKKLHHIFKNRDQIKIKKKKPYPNYTELVI